MIEESKKNLPGQAIANPLDVINQVSQMGFPVELVFKAYNDCGPDPEKMILHIYNQLD